MKLTEMELEFRQFTLRIFMPIEGTKSTFLRRSQTGSELPGTVA